MFPLLILREEIVCLIILIFLWLTSTIYKLGKDSMGFKRITFFATAHVVFDIITILTVNNLDTVPLWLNFITHAFFYLFAILFSREFLCYITSVCYSKKSQRKIRIFSLIPLALYVVALPFLPIDYVVGNGTNYSYGIAAFVGYALAMVMFIFSAVIIAVNYRHLDSHIRIALVPMLVSLVATECIQIVVPELLFTGGAATIITIGFFFSLENPVIVFNRKLMTDTLTGVKSRHSYEIDMKRFEDEYANDNTKKFGLVFFDINNLKFVNDRYGHLEGDSYITDIAHMLISNIVSCEGIYRMGGDEFLAIYRGKDEDVICREINAVTAECEHRTQHVQYKISVAMGYAMSGPDYQSLRDVLRVADYVMYKNKAEMKKPLAVSADGGSELNVAGLTGNVFDAILRMERNCAMVCNMSTNVSRWSKAAVDCFGLPGEFVCDWLVTWTDYIHPDDVDDYRADILAMLSEQTQCHNVSCRVRNKNGEYIMCTFSCNLLKGKGGEPDLFAFVVDNHEE